MNLPGADFEAVAGLLSASRRFGAIATEGEGCQRGGYAMLGCEP